MDMATVANFTSAQPQRLKSFVVPREHGAWGMLLIPLMTGAAVGFASSHAALPLVLFVTAALSLFGLRTPVEAWFGASALRPSTPEERRVVLYSIFSYAAAASFAVGWLLFEEKALGLIFIGTAAAIIFGLQASLRRIGRPARMASQLVGAIGLTSTAAGAYYVVTGALGQQAFALWALNWVFAANQIHFVQLRIHGARAGNLGQKLTQGRWFLMGEALTVCLLAAAWWTSRLPGLAVLAFAPVLFRGLYWFLEAEKPLVIHRLGLTELLHALAFGVLLIVGFQL
jgi:hypothetical protein